MSKCWYCNKELTSANYCEDHMGICNKCYSEMFKVSNDFVKGLTDKIANLEAKLAESKEQLKQSREWFIKCDKERLSEETKKNIAFTNYKETLQENEQLKQQLAEKEARIAELEDKDWYEGTIKQLEEQNERLIKQLAEKDEEIISLECVISEIHNDIKELHEFKVGEDEYDLTDGDARFSLQCDLLNNEQDKISFCIEQLEQLRYNIRLDNSDEETGDMPYVVDTTYLFVMIDNQIRQLKEKYEKQS